MPELKLITDFKEFLGFVLGRHKFALDIKSLCFDLS